jgi:RNA polymerase sigma-54 factor
MSVRQEKRMAEMMMNFEHSQQIKQMQRLMMSAKMQQAMQLLQSSTMELAGLIEGHLEQNPLLMTASDSEDDDFEANEEEIEIDLIEQPLSFDENDFTNLQQLNEDSFEQLNESEHNSTQEQYHSFREQSISFQQTLFENLMLQAQEFFDTPEELAMAEVIIGEFTSEGYLETPLKEIARNSGFQVESLEHCLKKIQTFEPLGVGAATLQECLLIQLRERGEQDSLAYQILEKFYDKMLHNDIPYIQKQLQCTTADIMNAIHKTLCHLDLHPGLSYSKQPTRFIVPDVFLKQEGKEWVIIINDDGLPALRINKKYLRLMEEQSVEAETKVFIQRHIASAKWLMRNIDQRNETLKRIVGFLLENQREFFEEVEGKLVPLTMKTVADDLGLHESTIARAVSNKYLDCPRGLFPLRVFFNNAIETKSGVEISSVTVRQFLQELINQEEKKYPLSDEELSLKLKEKGIVCARRTIAKYRVELNLGNAHQRKRFVD